MCKPESPAGSLTLAGGFQGDETEHEEDGDNGDGGSGYNYTAHVHTHRFETQQCAFVKHSSRG